MLIRYSTALFICLILFTLNASSQNVNVYVEDFETDGNNSRYTLSHQFYDFGISSYFGRGTLAQFTGLPSGITGLNGSYLVAAEDLDRSTSGPSDGVVTFTTRQIKVDSFSDLIFIFKLGARSANNYDFFAGSNRDWLDVDVRYDGGSWTRLMQFRNGPTASTNSQRMYRDNDLDNLGGEQAQDSILSETMQAFRDTTAVTGDTAEFRIRLRCNSSSEELFFDQIVVKGIPLNTPPSTLNRMLYQYMGYTTNNLQDNLYCTTNGSATSYEFEISGTGFTTQNIVNTTNKFNLTEVTGMTYNRTYNLRHRIITSGGPGVWSDAYYGLWTINVLTAQLPQVMAPQCGGNITLLSDQIDFERIGNATNYRLNVTGPSAFAATDTLNSTNNEFTLADLGATEAGDYDIQVSAFVDGSWQAFGSTCTVTLSSLTPQISLLSSDCGGIVTNKAQLFYTENVANAEYYEWRIRGDGDPIVQLIVQTNERKMRISDLFPTATYGEDYTLDVRYRVNSMNAPFGPNCDITLSAPTINIRKPTCGSTITDSLDRIWTFPVADASYEYSVYNTFFDTLITSSAPYLVFNQLDDSYDLSTINISVRPIITGETTTFGDTCTYTYTQARMAGGKRASEVLFGLNASENKVFPNPNSGHFSITGNLDEIEMVSIFDLRGKKLMAWNEADIASGLFVIEDFPNGQYILRIIKTDKSSSIHRLIKE
ncbi:T9SS type A sorting domain-containing protein [Hyphobacterium sp. CCMP332]|nr:T9SS type A sorting domain-containing protein [Hyphobacterium sp. CCMP332]